METINATEAAKSFGEVMVKAQQEPVCINKHGKPSFVMMTMNEFESLQASRDELLHQRLDQALEDVKANRVVDGPEFMESIKKKYFDANV